ncbi:hypothetical protein JSR02_00560 [Candidatus Vidania fulgoroideae]|uniref:Glutamyl/glutaminyl-tRNA synthetase class Ib catalytic domain-containing protein n=1 Tax=Candidatus Vidania fulgoroideorum TaxID=881286 RepID=A0A975ADP2_9PROT|nr:hypothetical protein JSR02_00560 [Candidatus Vidania fulgoroideae]
MAHIITRFAPSPSGSLHIGNLRIALIAWVFACAHKGKFYMRFDNINIKCYVKFQLACLRLLHVFNIATSLLFQQVMRQRLYYRFAWLLVLGRNAYFLNGALWFITASDLGCFFDYLRFKLISAISLYNFIIMRSNGFAVYNFCSVIDDHLMGISYVIRGCDHLSNTCKQVVLAKTLGCYLGKFFHLPLIVNNCGFKLSKRITSFDVMRLVTCGFLRKVIVCYLLGLHMTFLKASISTYLLVYFSLNCLLVANFKYDINRLVCYNNFAITTIVFIKIYAYLANFFFSPIYLTHAITTLVLARSGFVSDVDYYYINYYLVLFTYTYTLIDKRILYALCRYLKHSTSTVFAKVVVVGVYNSLAAVYIALNMFFFNNSINVPALATYLDSLGSSNLVLILNHILFI